MTESRGTLPKALFAGVKVWWGQDYNTHPEFWSRVFTRENSDMAHEEDVELGGTGLASTQSEGGSTAYDNMRQGPTTSYTHMRYSLGYIVTEDEFDDNQYEKVARARTTSLAFSFRTTKEVVAANVLNRAATSGYNGGDGVTLLSTAHPRLDGSTWANRTTAMADLSEAAVEDILKLQMAAENTMGHPIPLRAKRLIVSTDNGFEATRIVKSTLQSGNSNNDINAMKDMGIFQEDPMIHPYLTDMDAWFITTDAPNGLKMYQRKNRVIRRETDFDTDNLKVKGVERYSFGWSDARGVYGSTGAG
jgi:hypothetical protein